MRVADKELAEKEEPRWQWEREKEPLLFGIWSLEFVRRERKKSRVFYDVDDEVTCVERLDDMGEKLVSSTRSIDRKRQSVTCSTHFRMPPHLTFAIIHLTISSLTCRPLFSTWKFSRSKKNRQRRRSWRRTQTMVVFDRGLVYISMLNRKFDRLHWCARLGRDQVFVIEFHDECQLTFFCNFLSCGEFATFVD